METVNPARSVRLAVHVAGGRLPWFGLSSRDNRYHSHMELKVHRARLTLIELDWPCMKWFNRQK